MDIVEGLRGLAACDHDDVTFADQAAESCHPERLAMLARARQSVRRHRPGEPWAELWGPGGFLCLFNVDFKDL